MMATSEFYKADFRAKKIVQAEQIFFPESGRRGHIAVEAVKPNLVLVPDLPPPTVAEAVEAQMSAYEAQREQCSNDSTISEQTVDDMVDLAHKLMFALSPEDQQQAREQILGRATTKAVN